MTCRSIWKIRVATPADVEALAAMRLALQEHIMRANNELLPMSQDGIASLPERYRKRIGDANARVLVVEVLDTGALAGMAVGRIEVREDLIPARTGHINNVWIEPAYRRQGICRALVQELLAFFAESGVQVLALDYVVGSEEAEQTWRRFGFRPVLTLAKADIDEVKYRKSKGACPERVEGCS